MKVETAPSIDLVMSVPGQISAAEADCLARLAGETAPGQDVVELGSYQGRSTCALALGSMHGPRNRVYAVDPHTEYVGPKGGCYGPADQKALYENIARLDVGEIVAVVSLPSVQAARSWPTQTVGLLFIDGNHRYHALRADVEAWYAHLVPAGLLALHDADLPDVNRVIHELVADRLAEPVGGVGTLRWLRKRERDV
jgi:predicted O-methyltransferase YrrM